MDQNQLIQLKELVDGAEATIKNIKKIIQGLADAGDITLPTSPVAAATMPMTADEDEGIIIEGTFTGQNMLGSDAKSYPVPANYASKSKLIPGDMLKLTISPSGKFIYKQIGPVERKQVLGKLVHENGQYKVITKDASYNVLLASVTYFKAEAGNQISLTVPALTESAWGAIENVIPANEEVDSMIFQGGPTATPAEEAPAADDKEDYTI